MNGIVRMCNLPYDAFLIGPRNLFPSKVLACNTLRQGPSIFEIKLHDDRRYKMTYLRCFGLRFLKGSVSKSCKTSLSGLNIVWVQHRFLLISGFMLYYTIEYYD